MPTELTNIINLFKDNFIIILLIYFILFYIIVGLLTWDIKKPMIYLGISNIVTGILIIILRLSLNSLSKNIPDYIKLVNDILPTILKPLLISGIISILIGIALIILYYIILKYKNEKIVVR